MVYYGGTVTTIPPFQTILHSNCCLNSPALIENSFVYAILDFNILAGVFDSAFAQLRHIANLQFFCSIPFWSLTGGLFSGNTQVNHHPHIRHYLITSNHINPVWWKTYHSNKITDTPDKICEKWSEILPEKMNKSFYCAQLLRRHSLLFWFSRKVR